MSVDLHNGSIKWAINDEDILQGKFPILLDTDIQFVPVIYLGYRGDIVNI